MPPTTQKIKKTEDTVWKQVKDLRADGSGDIKCTVSGTTITFSPGQDGAGSIKRTFVLFNSGQSLTTIGKFLGEIKQARVSCGFTLAEAFQYERVIIIGKRSDYSTDEKDTIEDADRNGFIIDFIDPTDATAEAKLTDLLT